MGFGIIILIILYPWQPRPGSLDTFSTFVLPQVSFCSSLSQKASIWWTRSSQLFGQGQLDFAWGRHTACASSPQMSRGGGDIFPKEPGDALLLGSFVPAHKIVPWPFEQKPFPGSLCVGTSCLGRSFFFGVSCTFSSSSSSLLDSR